MKIGIAHTTLLEDDGSIPDPAEVARHLEGLGLDSMWASDHLAWGTPILESTLALAAAAGVTERIELGFSVMQLALRPIAWAAKQIGTLQTLSAARVQLGVGIGGYPADEWPAAGQSLIGRARRTDAALRVLPDLLVGKPTELPGVSGSAVTLRPGAPMPPIWIGGDSEAALRRAARFGDGWLPASITLPRLRAGRDRLEQLSGPEGRPAPVTGISVFGTLNAHLGGMSRAALVDMMAGGWGFDRDVAEAAVLSGTPDAVAERLAAYRDCGVEHVVVCPLGNSWRRQCELLTEAVSLLG
ncbi:LLM class flavin-dependent oxidoreductase [Nocardia sp. BMG51109]|uniref:LLM class flavin-dependent oxidoreductase n=1 Tax=Nocardia sp. BMG51109 TaxID=1056816 RepID=UPI0004643262|nr:LLM class flavin-dependent oxidoreductase [Nocardia sp. BMG51109]